MKILVAGGTGNVGGAVVKELLKRRAQVRVLARKQPEPGRLPAGVEVALGDLLDPMSLEAAMDGVDRMFLVNAVAADTGHDFERWEQEMRSRVPGWSAFDLRTMQLIKEK